VAFNAPASGGGYVVTQVRVDVETQDGLRDLIDGAGLDQQEVPAMLAQLAHHGQVAHDHGYAGGRLSAEDPGRSFTAPSPCWRRWPSTTATSSRAAGEMHQVPVVGEPIDAGVLSHR
jgi:hypothetical protein